MYNIAGILSRRTPGSEPFEVPRRVVERWQYGVSGSTSSTAEHALFDSSAHTLGVPKIKTIIYVQHFVTFPDRRLIQSWKKKQKIDRFVLTAWTPSA